MRFGMNVKVTNGSGESAIKFLKTIAKSGAQAVRITCSPSDDVLPVVLKVADDLKLKCTLAPVEITPESANDWYERTRGGFEALTIIYEELASIADAKRTLGLILPQGLHFITKTTSKPGAFGLRRDQVNLILSKLIDIIHKSGNLAVMPMRVDDAQGKVYQVGYDVAEFEGMLSPSMNDSISKALLDSASTTPYWLGKAGVMGGYIMPAQQAKALRKLETIASGASYAFLWSEEASPKWSWSVSGEMVLDLLDALAPRETIKPSGDPAIAHWKNQSRSESL